MYFLMRKTNLMICLLFFYKLLPDNEINNVDALYILLNPTWIV